MTWEEWRRKKGATPAHDGKSHCICLRFNIWKRYRHLHWEW